MALSRRTLVAATSLALLGAVLALMFLVILGTVQAFGGSGSGIFNTAMTKLRTAMGG